VTGGDAEANLLSNPGFETGGTGGDFNGGAEIDDGTSDTFTGWAAAGVNDGNGDKVEATGSAHSGSAALMITATTGSPYIRSTPPGPAVAEGLLYLFSYWTRGDGTDQAQDGMYDTTNAEYMWSHKLSGVTGAVYAQIKKICAAPAGCTNVRPYFWVTKTAAPGTGYVDDVSLLECHADYIDVSEADVQLVANVTTPASGTDPFGLILRRNGATQWLVQITPGTAGTDFELIELNNGVPTSRANADVDWTADTSYEIQVSCSGDDINVYADGSLELTYGTGTVGQANTQFGWFDSADDNATLDDIQIMNKEGAYEQLSTWTQGG